MAERIPAHSVSQREMDLWSRVIGRRRAEWSSLSRTELVAIIRPVLNSEPSPPALEDPWEQTEWLLTRDFNIAVDRKVSPKQRRLSWHRVNTLLQSLDRCMNTAKRNRENGSSNKKTLAGEQQNSGSLPLPSNFVALMQSNISDTTTTQQNGAPAGRKAPQAPPESSFPAPLQQRRTQSALNRASSVGKQPVTLQKSVSSLVSPHSSALTAKKPIAATGEAQQPSVQKPSPQRQPPVQQKPAPAAQNLPSQAATKPRASIPRATPTPPDLSPRPVNKQSIGSTMGSAFSSTAKVAPLAATQMKVTPANATKTQAAPPARPLSPVSISFVADMQRFACAIDRNGRSSVRVTFTPRTISNQESTRTMERLKKWDPYWKIEHEVATLETFPITGCENLKTGTQPQQATECTIKLPPQYAQMIRDWGKPTSKKFKHGETRLIVRMLPVKPVEKKRPRADTHLWPKGTFVQLGGRALAIDQRRQQQHDPKEWKSMSSPLDLTSRIANPTDANKLQLYFLDKEPYVMYVALCSYVSPDALNSVAWNDNWIRKLSMEEAKAKALENANLQTVVLDDTERPDDVNSFIFRLSCPVSQQILATPVRGEHCKHWQCFDLRNFVESNSHVTGTRWECPVCAKILSLRELQYCPLTTSILNQYKTEATPHRDRVQFFANGTWKLLDEAKKRYSKKRPSDGDSVNGNKRVRSEGAIPRPKGSPEVIELL